MGRLFTFTALLLAVCANPTTVWAHAEEPNSQNVVAIDDGWVVRANVGIVESANPDRLICEEAFLGGDGWMLGVLGPREWLTFGETAVMRTEDGCDFTTVAALERRPSDATVHAPSGTAAFLMNGVADNTGVWASTDRGQTFALIQTLDPATDQTTGIRFLDAETLIVSGYSRVDDGAGRAWSIDVSTGTATPLTVPDGTTYPYVLDAAEGRVLLLARRGDQIVFWGPTDDLGQNEWLAETWPSWARLSDDGRTAWISGTSSGRGVARGTLDAADVATWATLADDMTAGCVEPVGEDIYICGLGRIDGFDVTRVSPDGAVEGVLDFRDFAGVRSDCPADTAVGRVCPLVWRELAPYFGIDPDAATDAGNGEPDSGSPAIDAGDGPPPPTSGDDGCATATTEPPGPGGLLLLFIVGLSRRRALTQKLRRCY